MTSGAMLLLAALAGFQVQSLRVEGELLGVQAADLDGAWQGVRFRQP